MTEFVICSFSNSKTFEHTSGLRVSDKTYEVLNFQILICTKIFLKLLGISNCATVILHESSCKTGT